MVTPLEDFFDDGLVNVSRSLVGRTRLVYPKVPVPSQFLDGMLARRIAMPTNVTTKVTAAPAYRTNNINYVLLVKLFY